MPIAVLNNGLSEIQTPEYTTATLDKIHPVYYEKTDQHPWLDATPPASDQPQSKRIVIISTDAEMIAGEHGGKRACQTENEFFNAILSAYDGHRGLRISPDDILQCVALAVCTCVNEHAEELRDVFVNHQGKKKLVVVVDSPPGQFDWSKMMDLMDSEVEKNVKTSLGLESDFTSSTRVTRTTATLMKMATMQKYFSYGGMCLGCGVRAVDLVGTLQDWQKLRAKVSATSVKIVTASGLMSNWFKHILVVIDKLIETYGRKTMTPELDNFWSRIVTYVPYGSGSQRYLSGWSQVLFPGPRYDKFPETLNVRDPSSELPKTDKDYYKWQDDMKKWAQICVEEPSRGTSSVEFELNDNGLVYATHVTIGHVGMRFDGTFYEPVVGYMVHAGVIEKPLVTDEEEKKHRQIDAVVTMRENDPASYRQLQDINMEIMIADQAAQLSRNH